jgi:hypothetical protein
MTLLSCCTTLGRSRHRPTKRAPTTPLHSAGGGIRADTQKTQSEDGVAAAKPLARQARLLLILMVRGESNEPRSRRDRC